MTASCSAQRTIEEQSVIGTEGNASTVTSHQDPSLAGYIQQRLAARGLQARAGANDDKGIRRGCGRPGRVDLTADDNAAAGLHLSISPSAPVERRRSAPRNIQHGLFADPDGTCVSLRLGALEAFGGSDARIENLEELVTATRQFSYQDEDQDLMPLQAFLSHAALEAGEGQADAYQDAVQLMTLHSAKGLEFPLVFIVGMEEGMFPSQMSLDEGGRLEEERRLAYVGVTRAMQKLTLTYAETRRLYGKEVYHRPSRFIGELPEECVEEVRLRASVSRPVNHRRMGTPISENDTGYKLGQRVRHPKFGEGTIVNLEGSGEHSRLQIAFPGEGIKWLVAAYARLETV